MSGFIAVGLRWMSVFILVGTHWTIFGGLWWTFFCCFAPSLIININILPLKIIID